MPTETDHIAKAVSNQRAIEHLLTRTDGGFPDWVVTIAFYKALHIVEALFARDPAISHTQTHEQRERVLKKTHRYAHVWKHYAPLFRASLVARYLRDGQGTVVDFSAYMPMPQVRSEILGHRLRQIENSARKMLSAESVKALDAPVGA